MGMESNKVTPASSDHEKNLKKLKSRIYELYLKDYMLSEHAKLFVKIMEGIKEHLDTGDQKYLQHFIDAFAKMSNSRLAHNAIQIHGQNTNENPYGKGVLKDNI